MEALPGRRIVHRTKRLEAFAAGSSIISLEPLLPWNQVSALASLKNTARLHEKAGRAENKSARDLL
jgi:hypothetical protein